MLRVKMSSEDELKINNFFP